MEGKNFFKEELIEFMKRIIYVIMGYFKRLCAFRHVLKRKNVQIRCEREKYRAEKAMNSILTAYVFYLAARYGNLRIPKAEISDLLGKGEVLAYSDGENYVIEVKNSGASGEEETGGETGKISRVV